MKILKMNRGEGKTTDLIKVSSYADIPIICRSRKMAEIIEERAKIMGLAIPKPMTLDMYKERGRKNNEKVLIDDIDLVLRMYLNSEIVCATTSCEINYPNNSISDMY